jgi:Tat protein secretion system quality control protein TatD with DNase activity
MSIDNLLKETDKPLTTPKQKRDSLSTSQCTE